MSLLSNKWMNILDNIRQNEWNGYNDYLRYINEVNLQEFQYKVNNYILVTKSFLYKINKLDNARCSFCDQESETIPHLFIHCNKVRHFWSFLKAWLQTHTNFILQLNLKNLVFPRQDQKENNSINSISCYNSSFVYCRVKR